MIIWILLLCVAVVAAWLWLLLRPGHYKPEQKQPFYGRNFAHRGLHTRDKTVPENSLAAFAAAVEDGYGMELDVQLSKDGHVVVFHDDTLDRVCGVHGRVDAFTLEQLREMRLCGTAQGIPLLTEVFDTVQGKAPMIVELKTGPRNTELCEKTLALLREYTKQYNGAYCIESFDPRIVAWFKSNAPDILRGQLSDAAPAFKDKPPILRFILANLLMNGVARPQFIAYGPGKKTWLVRWAEKMGAIRVCWTVRPDDDIAAKEQQNDMVIFEFYRPSMRFK